MNSTCKAHRRPGTGHALLQGFFSLVFLMGLVPGAALAQVEVGELVVQLRTDATPGVHFDTVRTQVWRAGTSAILETDVHAADPGRDYGRGVRVAEFVLGLKAAGVDFGREFRGTTALMLGGGVAVERPWRVTLTPGDLRVITILLPFSFEPVEQATKTISLYDDADQNGSFSPCDILEYKISFTATHDVSRGILQDDPRPSAELVQGTVTTSHGRVFRGNVLSHETVFVRSGFVPEGETMTVTFLAKVPPVSNQGELTLELAGSTARYDILTDDPDTAETNDPTVVPTCPVEQFPNPGGVITELPPPASPNEVVTEWDTTVSTFVASTLMSAQEVIDEALAEAEENPEEADAIAVKVGVDLVNVELDGLKQLVMQLDAALTQASDLGADKHQLKRIRKTAKFGKKMMKEIIKRLDDRFDHSVPDVSQRIHRSKK